MFGKWRPFCLSLNVLNKNTNIFIEENGSENGGQSVQASIIAVINATIL